MTARFYSGCLFWYVFLLSRKSQPQTLDRTLFPSVSHDVLKVVNVLNHASTLCRIFITDNIIFPLGYYMNGFIVHYHLFTQFEHVIAIKY